MLVVPMPLPLGSIVTAVLFCAAMMNMPTYFIRLTLVRF